MARDKEVVPLVDILLIGVQRGLHGSVARAGDGACGQTADGVGVVQGQHVIGDCALLRPAEVLRRRGVPQIVVLAVLHDIAAGVGFQLVLGPLRVAGFQAVVEAGADLGVLALQTGLLLNEAGQLDHVVQARALGGDRVGQSGGLGRKLAVEGIHIVGDALVLIEIVGVWEKVALALHQAVIVGDGVPEIVLAPIRAVAAVGAGQEGVHVVHKARVHENLRHTDGCRALGNRDVHRCTAGHDGQRLDNVVVGHAGLDFKVTVLDLTGLAAVLDVLLEQPVILDDTGVLELGRNAGDGRTLGHGDGLGRAQRFLAVQLGVELADLVAAKADQRQNDEHDQAAKRETAAGLLVLLVVLDLLHRPAAGLFGGLFLFGLRRLCSLRGFLLVFLRDFLLGQFKAVYLGLRLERCMALHRLGRRLLRICAIDPHGRLLTFYGAQGHRDSLILAAEFITSLGEGGGRRPEGANLATARNISDYIRLSPPPPAGGAPSQRGPGLQQHPEIRIGHGEGAA